MYSLDVSIDVPDTLDLSALRGTGQQPGEELLPEVAPPPLMTPDVEVKGILGSHGNEEDDSLYSPLLCQSVCLSLLSSAVHLSRRASSSSFFLCFLFLSHVFMLRVIKGSKYDLHLLHLLAI